MQGFADPSPIEIVTTRAKGTVGGVVRGSLTQTVPYAWVSVIPSPPNRGKRNLFHGVRADAQGRFSIPDILPGEYKVFAFGEIPHGAAGNETFVSRYESLGVPFSIVDGQTVTIDPTEILP